MEESCIFNSENIYDIFLISDMHLFHRNIIEYAGRPDYWQEMLIRNWNQVVTKDDIVLHLGDLTFGNKEMTKKVIDQLPGRIFNLKGNHDRKGVKWFDDVGVTLIKNPFIVDCPEDGIKFYFSHRPQCDVPPYTVSIAGHVHEKGDFIYESKKRVHINVSVEKTDYRPIRLSSLMLHVESLQMGKGVI